MAGFDLRASGIGSDWSANWATTTAQDEQFFIGYFYLLSTTVLRGQKDEKRKEAQIKNGSLFD